MSLSHEEEESCEVGENDGNPDCKQGKDCVGIHEAFLLNRLIQDHLEKKHPRQNKNLDHFYAFTELNNLRR